MKSIYFLTLHRPDRSPSQRFRFEQYINYIAQNGFKPLHFFLLNQEDDKAFYGKSKFSKLLILLKSVLRLFQLYFSIEKGSIVFVQRECFMLGTSFFERLFSRKGKLVFDFDDSIWLQNVSEANKNLAFLKNPAKTSEIIALSRLVFAGNAYLKNYASQFNSNVVIVPTTIDTEEYKPVKQQNANVVIGWSGSVTTIQHFEFALPILDAIKEKYGNKVSFKVIGDGNYRNEKLGIVGLPWKKEDEVKEISSFDIGFMPLPNDEWASGKCGLKGLQYMALEVPTIMSPVGVNSEIIQQGENGYLAETQEEWVEKLSLLIEDEQLRLKLGKAGRATVVQKFSVLAWQDKYVQLFNDLNSSK